MSIEFKRKRLNEISDIKIFEELENVAKHFNYIEFWKRDFDKISGISSGTIINRFNGSWINAMESLKKHLQEKDLDLLPRPHAPNRVYSDKVLFDEMDRIWKVVWQRPSRDEWEMSNPKISYQTYRNRFGWWKNACLKFIEYKMKDEILNDDFIISDKYEKNTKIEYKSENSRNISLSLRLAVLNRDNFRCVFCGKSPATDLWTKLHIDHIKPFSKWGKSTLENLQTLCAECNLWKSNNENIWLTQ